MDGFCDFPAVRPSAPEEALLIDVVARALSERRHAGRRWNDLDRASLDALRGDAAAAFDALRPYLAAPYCDPTGS